ncbi:MAG: S-methyl-5-thioribose-1-phosphate isomerase [Cyclobacteriaceae bacterium]|nr:S-methyl-5-thioribose-1-phosphate isomerase [Cyclobacteriaceae bacterium HetDA_MAG_MS6]
MLVQGQRYRTIWEHPEDAQIIQIIDQRPLPHQFVIEEVRSVNQMAKAIKEMHLRGAGLIGAAAGYGMYLATLEALRNDHTQDYVLACGEQLKATRPTAVNLEWAVNRQLAALREVAEAKERVVVSLKVAREIANEDASYCQKIGEYGLDLITNIADKKQDTVNILTHCNAGWLAFVDFGSATAPIYSAHQNGIKLHVWVDETRPRNQGARLTAWELHENNVPYTVISDNVGGHLMQHGLVDMVIVGSDRTTHTGDVANKIGTYLKALAAHDNQVPFYVALPSSTIDWSIDNGIIDIPIEQREGEEVKYIQGLSNGVLTKVLLTPEGSNAANYAFDVTPARLITGLITERGVCPASREGILTLFPERK